MKQYRGRNHTLAPSFCILVNGLIVAIVAAGGCAKHSPSETELRLPATTSSTVSTRDTSCVLVDRGTELVQSRSARVVLGTSAFTVDVVSTIPSTKHRGLGAASTQMVIKKNGATVLEVSSQAALATAQVTVLAGQGFQGPRRIHFTNTDRHTLNGDIDGRKIAPLATHATLASLRLSDGSAIPTGTMDDDIKLALPALISALATECPPSAPHANASLKDGLVTADSDPHYSDPISSPACITCLASTNAGFLACATAAIIASAGCAFFYPVCLAAAELICTTAYIVTLATGCHAPPFSNSGGGPCCPLACTNNQCCDVDETCAGNSGLCCASGQTACGNGACCGPSEKCMPDGTCCGNTVCNGVCCAGSHQICNPNTQQCCAAGAACGNSCCGPGLSCISIDSSTCCPSAHACGTICCASNESCVDPTKGQCAACANCAGECCFGKCCGGHNACNPDSHLCMCVPNCQGKCGGVSDGCNGTCNNDCEHGLECFEGSCCHPNCTGKCGGAPDTCGGPCLETCGGGAICFEQSCCTPNCINKKCGETDGCGRKCDGSCPPGNACSSDHTCEPFKPKCPGLFDCCGDGTCCLPLAKCYDCQCKLGTAGR